MHGANIISGIFLFSDYILQNVTEIWGKSGKMATKNRMLWNSIFPLSVFIACSIQIITTTRWIFCDPFPFVVQHATTCHRHKNVHIIALVTHTHTIFSTISIRNSRRAVFANVPCNPSSHHVVVQFVHRKHCSWSIFILHILKYTVMAISNKQ